MWVESCKSAGLRTIIALHFGQRKRFIFLQARYQRIWEILSNITLMQLRDTLYAKSKTLSTASFRRIPLTMLPAPGLRAALASCTFCISHRRLAKQWREYWSLENIYCHITVIFKTFNVLNNHQTVTKNEVIYNTLHKHTTKLTNQT
jgi:hypothetical protein